MGPHRLAAGAIHPARNTGRSHSVGVRADGSVLAAGDGTHGQCRVDRWSDVVEIAAGSTHSLAQCSDETVLATGDDHVTMSASLHHCRSAMMQ